MLDHFYAVLSLKRFAGKLSKEDAESAPRQLAYEYSSCTHLLLIVTRCRENLSSGEKRAAKMSTSSQVILALTRVC
jgi:hypothetical protein